MKKPSLLLFELAGAESAFLLDVVVFGDGWDLCSFAFELTEFAQDHFRAAAPFGDLAENLDVMVFQLAHITDVLQCAGEDHDGEGALLVVLTEIQVERATFALADIDDFALHAAGFT